MFGSIMRRPDVIMVEQWRAAENDIKKDSFVWKDVTVETQHGAFYDVDADCIGITKWTFIGMNPGALGSAARTGRYGKQPGGKFHRYWNKNRRLKIWRSM